MHKEKISTDILDGCHTDGGSVFWLVPQIVGYVDREKDSADQGGDCSEQPSQKPQKAKEDNGIKANFIKKFGLLCVDER
jgi:hypothetical protein